MAGAVAEEEAGVAGFEDGAQAGFVFADGLFGLFAFGDVADDEDGEVALACVDDEGGGAAFSMAWIAVW